MDLDGFKKIYYIEWSHRILGRALGLQFFLPLAYFLKKGYLMPKLKRRLLFMTLIGLA